MLGKLRTPEELPTWTATDLRRKWSEFARDLRKHKFIAIVDKGQILTVAIEPETYRRIQKAATAREKRTSRIQLLAAFQIARDTLANILNVEPVANERIERLADIYIRELRNYLRPLGGELEIQARIGSESFKIDSFEDVLSNNNRT